MKLESLVRHPATHHGLRLSEAALPRRSNRLTVFTYHRVSDDLDDGRHAGLVSATPTEFEHQVAVVERNFRIVSISDVIDAVRGRSRLPRRALLLTFDDAVDDFSRHALPVLRGHRVPAVVFVPTAFADRPNRSFWWDAVHAAVTRTDRTDTVSTPIGSFALATAADRATAFRRIRAHCKDCSAAETEAITNFLCNELGVSPPPASVMDWPTLAAIHAEGLVAVCAHTRTHPHLDHCHPDEVRDEIGGSLDDLRRELGSAVPALAYPAGRVTDEVAGIAAESGVEVAFTTSVGVGRVGAADPLRMPRINVGRRAGINAARVQALPVVGRAFGSRRHIAIS